MASDITSLRQLLEQCTLEMEAWEARFNNIIVKNADGIIIVDRAGIVRFANPAAESIFGRKAEEFVGQMFGFPIVAGETTDIDIIRRQGEIAIVEMRVTETEWEGRIVYLASLRDITERKRKEVLRFKTDYAGALLRLGMAYEKLGHHKEAVDAYKQSIAIRPDYALAHFGLALAFLGLRDRTSALQIYERLKSLDESLAKELHGLIYK